jgi:hypothetical protein
MALKVGRCLGSCAQQLLMRLRTCGMNKR